MHLLAGLAARGNSWSPKLLDSQQNREGPKKRHDSDYRTKSFASATEPGVGGNQQFVLGVLARGIEWGARIAQIGE